MGIDRPLTLFPAGVGSQDYLRRNKENVQAFYDLMFNQSRPADAIARWWLVRTEAGR